MASATMTQPAELTGRFRHSSRRLLWIDGVGSFLICLDEQVTIGGPAFGSEGADISLLASLSRSHATILRIDENYLLQPHAAASIDGREVQDRSLLGEHSDIRLGRNVELKFRLPNVLSRSACIGFASQHRPHLSVDGIVLMDENFLMGPGVDQHVHCPGWSHSLVMYRREGQLWCRTPIPLRVNESAIVGAGPVPDGATVSGDEIRFRIETVESN
jgi:hypothetical protein